MEVYLDRQLYQLASALILGMLAGMFYDAIRVAASLLTDSKVKTAVSDTLFWVTTILAVFFFNIAFFSGETSWYFPFAMGVGGAIYMHLLSGHVVALFNLAVLPLRIVLKGLKKATNFVKRGITRAYLAGHRGLNRFLSMHKRQKNVETTK
jgi:lysylphosphatidylglycerol synthetase-like protein (DUF2156 family)